MTATAAGTSPDRARGDDAPPHGGLYLPLLAGLLLAVATPSTWAPWAGPLALPALALFFALARDPRRPLWHGYLFGCVHMALFSWSVHHVLVFAWAMIVLLGGCYYLAVHAAVRRLPANVAPLGFGVALAGSYWLRAHMPDICYPHGQPAHALWQWPALLGSVTVGGEALANALLGWLGASVAELAASWRAAATPWRASYRRAAIAAATAAALTIVGHALRPAGDPGATIDVALVEPGFHLVHELDAAPPGQERKRFEELFAERLLAPTRALLAQDPPDLVLWPESSVFATVPVGAIAAGEARVPEAASRLPASPAHLVLGVNVRQRDDAAPTPAAVQIELPSGRILGHQEKRRLVPGGEFQPGVRWLPRAAADWLLSAFAGALGSLPMCEPGRELPPLRTAGGVPFGALLCYDNAFAQPAAAQVAQGARLLCVLSNEAWYEGGAELPQLVAMTVLRALETGTPVVRCTQDGWSAVVGGDGRILAQLPMAPAPQPAARTLRVKAPLGAGAMPPTAWLQAAFGIGAAVSLAAMLALGWRRRGWRR